MKPSRNRLFVVSNRLPYVFSRGSNGRIHAEPSSGGLINALVPVLRNRGGLWVGWPGTFDLGEKDLEPTLKGLATQWGYTLKPVTLTEKERDHFYYGFSNEVIWPLFHDLQSNCNFNPDFWRTYQQVNQKFAHIITKNAKGDDYIWVHDYHFMEVARQLRMMGNRSKLGFFLHIPFPSLDIFLKLPWRFEILRGLLEFDLIGFQTLRDRRNFIQCVRTLIKDVTVQGKGQVINFSFPVPILESVGRDAQSKEREIQLGVFPIGIDFNYFSGLAASDEVGQLAQQFRENVQNKQIILGVDRLDYTKGIPNRLEAFRNALTRFPELHRKVVLIQQVIPSRADIPEYHDLRLSIEQLVSEINGEFTDSGWVPIHYIFRSFTPTELLAYYRAAEIALVTPLKDGMNLVAKEYCAANVEENGVLILSEFAGAAAQLQKNALLVNPHDVESVADRIYEAFKMSQEERRSRIKRLQRSIRELDVFWWVDSYLNAAIEKNLSDFSVVEDYIPERRVRKVSLPPSKDPVVS